MSDSSHFSSIKARLRSSHSQRKHNLGLSTTEATPHQSIQPIQYVGAKDLQLAIDNLPFINYSLYSTGKTPAVEIQLHNAGLQASQNLMVCVNLQPSGYSATINDNITALPAGDTWQKHYALPLISEALRQVNESKPAWLEISITDKDERLATARAELKIHAYNEWFGLMPTSIAAFVQSNSECLTTVFEASKPRLQERLGNASFSGYQSNNKNYVIAVITALHQTLCHNIAPTYINPPPSFEQTGQKIRLIKTQLAEKKGTCLDLAVLQAAIWEHAGFHPGIILVPGHAMLYCWLQEQTPPKALTLLNDPASYQHWLQLIENGDIIVLNSVEITAKQNLPQACHHGMDILQQTIQAQQLIKLIDIRACRLEGIHPMALE